MALGTCVGAHFRLQSNIQISQIQNNSSFFCILPPKNLHLRPFDPLQTGVNSSLAHISLLKHFPFVSLLHSYIHPARRLSTGTLPFARSKIGLFLVTANKNPIFFSDCIKKAISTDNFQLSSAKCKHFGRGWIGVIYHIIYIHSATGVSESSAADRH